MEPEPQLLQAVIYGNTSSDKQQTIKAVNLPFYDGDTFEEHYDDIRQLWADNGFNTIISRASEYMEFTKIGNDTDYTVRIHRYGNDARFVKPDDVIEDEYHREYEARFV